MLPRSVDFMALSILDFVVVCDILFSWISWELAQPNLGMKKKQNKTKHKMTMLQNGGIHQKVTKVAKGWQDQKLKRGDKHKHANRQFRYSMNIEIFP